MSADSGQGRNDDHPLRPGRAIRFPDRRPLRTTTSSTSDRSCPRSSMPSCPRPRIRPGAAILDLACGTGFAERAVLTARSVSTVESLDSTSTDRCSRSHETRPARRHHERRRRRTRRVLLACVRGVPTGRRRAPSGRAERRRLGGNLRRRPATDGHVRAGATCAPSLGGRPRRGPPRCRSCHGVNGCCARPPHQIRRIGRRAVPLSSPPCRTAVQLT